MTGADRSKRRRTKAEPFAQDTGIQVVLRGQCGISETCNAQPVLLR